MKEPPATEDDPRAALRTRVFLRSVLPLMEVLAEERPEVARLPLGGSAAVQIQLAGSEEGAALCWRDGRFSVEQGVRAGAEVRWTFRDRRALNAFFAGRPALPRVAGFGHPLAMWAAGRMLASLRILEPGQAPATTGERALRVKLLLYLVTRAMAELYRGGFAEMVHLVDGGPERVYQWTVDKSDIGAYLRMAPGRVKAGRGTYGGRRPFVHYLFANVEAAFAVLTATGSQMGGVRSGALVTHGSPEYTRKIALMMQNVDGLLREG